MANAYSKMTSLLNGCSLPDRLVAVFTSGTSNGLPTHRTAAADSRRGARPRSGGVQGKRAKVYGWYVSLVKHEEARRYWGAWHVGSRRIWRPRLAGIR